MVHLWPGADAYLGGGVFTPLSSNALSGGRRASDALGSLDLDPAMLKETGATPPALGRARWPFFGHTTVMDQKTRRKRTCVVFKQHRAFAAQHQAPSPIVKKDPGLTPPCISVSILTYPHLPFRTTQSPLVLGAFPNRVPP